MFSLICLSTRYRLPCSFLGTFYTAFNEQGIYVIIVQTIIMSSKDRRDLVEVPIIVSLLSKFIVIFGAFKDLVKIS